jgi:hypothetical protein
MSLGEMQRGLGDNLQDWQVGQQFMRQQYLLHLQKTEGFIDTNKFLPTESAGHEAFYAHPEMWAKTKHGIDVNDTFKARDEARQLPHQLFEDFSKGWIEEAKGDSSHKFHGVAKQLDDIGIFMPPNSMRNVNGVRQSGEHRDYEKSKIKANKRDKPLALITHVEEAPKKKAEDDRPIPSTRTHKGLRLYLDLTK